jgi:hypothetical protein
MPGYFLVEQKYLSPPKPEGRGIKANARRIGFTDFLRELEYDEFPYNENTSLLVQNLEDLLLYSRPEMVKMAREIHYKLQRVANEFERIHCPWVQIVFKYTLLRGEKLCVIMKPEDQPIHLIFGSPVARDDGNGNVYYTTAFNLSSP